MIKAKKLLSILCSAAMVVSVFASTIANAASGATDEVALGLNYKLVSETDLVKVFDVYATGLGELEAWSTYINIDGEVDKVASVTSTENSKFSGGLTVNTSNIDADTMTHYAGWFSAKGVDTAGDMQLNRITITLNAALTKPLVITTNDEAELSDPVKNVQEWGGYSALYMDNLWQANTLTFDVLKSEPAKESVAATQVGSVFEGVNEASDPTTDRAVAAMVDTTLKKAITEITWKIDVTAQDGKTYSGPTELKIPVANLEANSPIKVGLVVSYADADIASVTITGIEY